METNPKIENYLAILERSLKQLPVSDRAEIVTEIKSHILSALERDPNASVDSVLHALGEADTVANRYLAERGHALVKPSVSPIVKWLVVGFLGTFGLLLFFVAAIAYKFSPLIRIDGDQDRVTLLGGLVDIDGNKDTLSIGGAEITGSSTHSGWSFSGGSREVNGHATVAEGSDTRLLVSATNAKIQVRYSDQPELGWTCRIEKDKAEPKVAEKDHQLTLDLMYLTGVKCDLRVPAKHALTLRVGNGKIMVEKPRGNLDITLSNGTLALAPDAALKYHYDLHVTNGKVAGFESSDGPDAIQIHAEVSNGKVGHIESED